MQRAIIKKPLKVAAVKAWESRSREKAQRIFIQVLKTILVPEIMLTCPVVFDPLNLRNCIKLAVIPKQLKQNFSKTA